MRTESPEGVFEFGADLDVIKAWVNKLSLEQIEEKLETVERLADDAIKEKRKMSPIRRGVQMLLLQWMVIGFAGLPGIAWLLVRNWLGWNQIQAAGAMALAILPGGILPGWLLWRSSQQENAIENQIDQLLAVQSALSERLQALRSEVRNNTDRPYVESLRESNEPLTLTFSVAGEPQYAGNLISYTEAARYPEMYARILKFTSERPGKLRLLLLGPGMEKNISYQTPELLALLNDREVDFTIVGNKPDELTAAAQQAFYPAAGFQTITERVSLGSGLKPVPKDATFFPVLDQLKRSLRSISSVSSSTAERIMFDRTLIFNHPQTFPALFDHLNYGEDQLDMIVATLSIIYPLKKLPDSERLTLLLKMIRALRTGGKLFIEDSTLQLLTGRNEDAELSVDELQTASGELQAALQQQMPGATAAVFGQIIEITKKSEVRAITNNFHPTPSDMLPSHIPFNSLPYEHIPDFMVVRQPDGSEKQENIKVQTNIKFQQIVYIENDLALLYDRWGLSSILFDRLDGMYKPHFDNSAPSFLAEDGHTHIPLVIDATGVYTTILEGRTFVFDQNLRLVRIVKVDKTELNLHYALPRSFENPIFLPIDHKAVSKRFLDETLRTFEPRLERIETLIRERMPLTAVEGIVDIGDSDLLLARPEHVMSMITAALDSDLEWIGLIGAGEYGTANFVRDNKSGEFYVLKIPGVNSWDGSVEQVFMKGVELARKDILGGLLLEDTLFIPATRRIYKFKMRVQGEVIPSYGLLMDYVDGYSLSRLRKERDIATDWEKIAYGLTSFLLTLKACRLDIDSIHYGEDWDGLKKIEANYKIDLSGNWRLLDRGDLDAPHLFGLSPRSYWDNDEPINEPFVRATVMGNLGPYVPKNSMAVVTAGIDRAFKESAANGGKFIAAEAKRSEVRRMENIQLRAVSGHENAQTQPGSGVHQRNRVARPTIHDPQSTVSLIAVAKSMTSKIVRISDLRPEILAKLFPLVLQQPEAKLPEPERQWILRFYTALFRQGSSIILPASLLLQSSPEAQRDYFKLLLSALRAASPDSQFTIHEPLLHITGVQNNALKNLFFSREMMTNVGVGSSKADISRAVKFWREPESFVAARLEKQKTRFAAAVTKSTVLKSRAFLVKRAEVRKLTRVQRVIFQARLTQLLQAASALNEEEFAQLARELKLVYQVGQAIPLSPSLIFSDVFVERMNAVATAVSA